MAMAGTEHLGIFLVCMAFWLYVLFVLPQVALPRLFGVPRLRLAVAQGGAAVANLVLVFVMVFTAGVVADRFGWLIRPGAATAGPPGTFDLRTSGMSAVERATQNTVFPLDTLGALIRIPVDAYRGEAEKAERRPRLRQRESP
jgi:hypothetical protein